MLDSMDELYSGKRTIDEKTYQFILRSYNSCIKGSMIPPHLAGNTDDIEDMVDHYRRVRDEIRSYIEELPVFPDIQILKKN